MLTTNWKTALCASGSAVLCGMMFKMFKETVNNKTKGKQCEIVINEVLFYGADDEEQMKRTGLNNLFCIYYVIAHASKSVDVCVPSFDSETLTKCLVNVQQKCNAKIRIAIHNNVKLHNLTSLVETSIEVKVIKSVERLEYEFILIDASDEANDAVALIGSLDYETTRVNCNRDSTLLTSDAIVVKALKTEFDRVWNYDAPIKSDYDVSAKLKSIEDT